MSKAKILILDADVSWTLAVSDALVREDVEMFSANSVTDALLLLQVRKVDLMVAEINLPGSEGLALVEQIHQVHPQVRLIVCTATPSLRQAVEAVKVGAFDYREKPKDLTALREVKESILQACIEGRTGVRIGVPDVRQRGLLSTPSQGFYGIISQNARMQDIFELIQTIADSQANVLIYGETGTG
ncbi:response regulator, partial [bacterium]|nr:response regulator [bacterium]